jgi:hypothetical protein
MLGDAFLHQLPHAFGNNLLNYLIVLSILGSGFLCCGFWNVNSWDDVD